jgi:diguanylate cyclase (GGDEF)-like protein
MMGINPGGTFPQIINRTISKMTEKTIRALLVEDNPADATLVKEMLRDEDAPWVELIHVERLAHAEKRLAARDIDVVLLDLLLPDGQGIESLKALRDAALEIPIVVLTGIQDDDAATQALQNGAQDYLVKGPDQGNPLVRSIRYAIERKRMELRVRRLAHFDSVTGLPNRALFLDRLERALAQAKRGGRVLGVLFLDLDHFKAVNDSLGHAAGDRLLKGVSDRLVDCLRGSDSVARLGGDEFAVVLSEVAQGEDASAVGQRLMAALRPSFDIEGHELFVTVSIGASIHPHDGEDAETLLKNADTAMYRAKQEGRDSFQLYSPVMNVNAAKRLTMENALRHALERGEFLLHYQPRMDLANGRIVGIEALLRWQHPDWGIVPPSEFVPLAEQRQMILPIGGWMFRNACLQNQAWQKAGLDPLPIGVKVASRLFNHKSFQSEVTRLLRETQLDPNYLELELAEGALQEAGEAALLTLREFKAAGARIVIDDFGTGHSSLRYLKRLSVDALKIDRSFISELTRDPDDAALVRTIILMAHNLGLMVIAEGVEKETQAAFLREQGCDRMQGPYFCPPVPAEAMTQMLREGWRRR